MQGCSRGCPGGVLPFSGGFPLPCTRVGDPAPQTWLTSSQLSQIISWIYFQPVFKKLRFFRLFLKTIHFNENDIPVFCAFSWTFLSIPSTFSFMTMVQLFFLDHFICSTHLFIFYLYLLFFFGPFHWYPFFSSTKFVGTKFVVKSFAGNATVWAPFWQSVGRGGQPSILALVNARLFPVNALPYPPRRTPSSGLPSAMWTRLPCRSSVPPAPLPAACARWPLLVLLSLPEITVVDHPHQKNGPK